MSSLDAVDRRILDELQRDGRLTIANLSGRIGLSASPCWRRVKRLEEVGVIRRYTALLEPSAVGLGLEVFVYVSLDLHHADAFEAYILDRDEVVECYAMTGEQDYLLHVMVADMNAFDRFLRHQLIHMPGVERVRSSFALRTIKQGTGVPLEEP